MPRGDGDTGPTAVRPPVLPDLRRRRRGRVLLICPGGLNSLGGIARIMGYLVDAWRADRQHAPAFAVIDDRGAGRAIWSPLFVASAILQMLWYRATGPVWLVHVNISDGLSLARKAVILAAARLLRLPVIFHSHAATLPQTYGRLPGFARRIVRTMYRSAAAVIVLGAGFRSYMIGTMGVPAGRVVIHDNAVPRPLAPRRKAGSGPCRLLFLGGLSARKGVPELLQALATPHLQALDWTMTLAGGGPVDSYREDAARLGIGERVRFTGWLEKPAVATLLAGADVLVLPSHDEGMPIAILEALSYGIPVLATPVGAIPEFLEDQISALLVPPGDVGALARALGRMVDEAPLRDRLGAAGQAVFDARFSMERFARDMTAIYRRFCP